MSKVTEITDAEFGDKVLAQKDPVLVYFWASWCGPCRLVSPSVDWVAENYSDSLKVFKLEVDPNPDAVAECKVEGVPALRLYKDQQLVDSHEGAISKNNLKEMLDRNLN